MFFMGNPDDVDRMQAEQHRRHQEHLERIKTERELHLSELVENLLKPLGVDGVQILHDILHSMAHQDEATIRGRLNYYTGFIESYARLSLNFDLFGERPASSARNLDAQLQALVSAEGENETDVQSDE